MSLALAAVLIIGTFVAAIGVAIGVPVVLALMAYDLSSHRASRRVTTAVRTEHESAVRIGVERGVARAFVIAGGAFWSIAAFAGAYSFSESGATSALFAALIPLTLVAATLIIGWYYERVTAVLLALASFAVVAWGIIYQFEPGVWGLMTFALLGPMITAATLFWLARRDQEAFERATSTRPDLAFVLAARSSIN
ncbi:MAG: hypothetical protein U1E26_06135 [Coriobacteriia bacterium]|nr:hypothetical protein [Coriobacteriia bacterium]